MSLRTLYPGIAFSPIATITVQCATGDTEITVSDLTPFPTAPNRASITNIDNTQHETIAYASTSSTNGVFKLTGVTREVEGTAQTWNQGTQICRVLTAKDWDDNVYNIEQLGITAGHNPVTAGTAIELGSGDDAQKVSVSFGTTSATACVGNDSRLSNARTPTTHTHAEGDITNLTSDLSGKEPSIGTKKSAFNVDFGTTTGTACEGNDSRLSDSRAVNIHGTTEETSIASDDEVLIYDTSAGANRRMTKSNFTAGISASDEKIKVSSNDTTAAYLSDKLVQGSNITLTVGNEAGDETLTIAASGGGGGLTWSEITDSATASVDSGYVCNKSSLLTVTLPTIAAVGKQIRLVGKGAGGWKLAQNANQYIKFGSLVSTTGTGGYIASSGQYDCIEILCTTANVEFTVISAIGNLDVV